MQKTKILYQFFTRNLFSSPKKNFFVLIIISTFSFSQIALAKTIIPNNLKCDATSQKLIKDNSYLTSSSPDFYEVISKIKNINSKHYNILVVSEHKPSPGYEISIFKIKMKKRKIIIYYSVEQISKSPLTVLSYPYCLLKIENLNKYKIKIKKKRFKFFPLNIF